MPIISQDNSSNKKLYVLLAVGLLLSFLYILFSQTIIDFMPATITDISLLILIACLPLLTISIIESYALTKMFKIKNAETYASAFVFCLFYIVIAFVNVAILFVSGSLA